MSAKAKQSKQRKSAKPTTTELASKAAASKANAKATAQPGVIASIMSALTKAKQSKSPVSVQNILDGLVKQFPDRTAAGMALTVRAQLSRLPAEKDFPITKTRNGRHVVYSAA